jgi:hypothetical protein
MAATLTVLKKTPNHCVVAISGDAAETINLATTLNLVTETPASPKVDIVGITWSVPVGEATVARNTQTLWELTLSNSMRFNGWNDTRHNGSDIVVTLPGGGGTVVLELMKASGYGRAQHPYPVVVTGNIDPVT